MTQQHQRLVLIGHAMVGDRLAQAASELGLTERSDVAAAREQA